MRSFKVVVWKTLTLATSEGEKGEEGGESGHNSTRSVRLWAADGRLGTRKFLELFAAEAETVGDNEDAAEGHGAGGEDGDEVAESGGGDKDDVVDEGPE
ncbi:MAG: hypothetical protein IH586_04965, partial [Anaerolineaceae bacterium]|nr:hypothetical protein [Anaerolineaceae bacterium]